METLWKHSTILLTVVPTETACEISSTMSCMYNNTEHIKDWTTKTESKSPM